MPLNRNIDFTKHPQYIYSQDLELFKSWRLAYYLNDKRPNTNFIYSLFEYDYKGGLLSQGYRLQKNINKIAKYNPSIFIITASYNRVEELRKIFRSICEQKTNQKIAWIIVDNGSSDNSLAQLESWDKTETWITYLSYKHPLGFATPARNRGLLFVQWVLKYCTGEKYYWVIDSDDLIHNEFVLAELYKEAQRTRAMMIHGFTVCNYKNQEGNLVIVNSIPRDLGKYFPEVRKLKDEFDAGPQNLAAIISCQELYNFYYPNEFTMEDDTLNQRIMLWGLKRKKKICGINYPCLIKTFHKNSMSGQNSLIGNRSLIVNLGPTYVTGIRAQVVLGILHLRDYFTLENL